MCHIDDCRPFFWLGMARVLFVTLAQCLHGWAILLAQPLVSFSGLLAQSGLCVLAAAAVGMV